MRLLASFLWGTTGSSPYSCTLSHTGNRLSLERITSSRSVFLYNLSSISKILIIYFLKCFNFKILKKKILCRILIYWRKPSSDFIISKIYLTKLRTPNSLIAIWSNELIKQLYFLYFRSRPDSVDTFTSEFTKTLEAMLQSQVFSYRSLLQTLLNTSKHNTYSCTCWKKEGIHSIILFIRILSKIKVY